MTRHQRAALRNEYGLDPKFVRAVETEIEKIDREAVLPDPKDFEIADLRAQVKRLEATIDKQADIQERSLKEIDRLEAENARLEEKWLATEDALAVAKGDGGVCDELREMLDQKCDQIRGLEKRIRGFESIARASISDPKTTDYCRACGESPESGSHSPFGHAYVDPRHSD